MFWLEISIIGVILAMDATVYAFSYGLVLRQKRALAALCLALTVGFYQFAMPLIGYGCGSLIREWVAAWSPWIVLIIFTALGGNIIREAWSEADDDEKQSGAPLGFLGLMLVGIATSIDALAVGGCMAIGSIGGADLSMADIWLACGLIGTITFILPLLSFSSTRLLHRLPTHWAETLAGLLLIGLGVKNLLS